MKSLLRFLLRVCFGYRTFGEEVLRTPGPVLLVPNHVSWLDWLFLGILLEDDWKFVTSSATAETSWFHRRVMLSRRTFPVDTTSPYAVRAMADHLAQGGRLVLFAEGRISLTGGLMKLFDGTGFLIRHTKAKVVTCYLRGANRVRFVRHRGWRQWFPRVTAHFSPVLATPETEGLRANQARERLTSWLRDEMVRQQFEVEMQHGAPDVLCAIAETARAIPGRIAIEDVTFSELTYRRLLIATRALASRWRHLLRASDGARVGVLLPNVNGTPVTLLSLWASGFVPALLNYSSGVPTLLACARLAGIQQIITSRRFLEKARLELAPLTDGGIELIFLEEVRPTISRGAKLRATLPEVFAPGRLGARVAHGAAKPDDTAVILFTSGSEGVPKGVELTHRNLLANVRQAGAVMDLTDDDRFFNALPIFHSFGLTAGTLFPLVRGCYTFLYPTPLHYRIVPTMVYDRACTVLLGTNTFLHGYARKAHPYDFNSVRYLVAGAEKVQSSTVETWAQKFGVRILEGYGATECSPCISLNTRMEPRVGSAGRLLPGIEARLEPVEGVEDGGRLFVRGPNVMKGYLNPDANARFLADDGWYDTGDIVHLDDDRFVTIRGRLKRFAKISGEMVSLTALEDVLAGAFPQYGPRFQVAVVTRPDADKGEVLIAVTNEPRVQLAEVRAAVRVGGLSNLAAPRELRTVRAIPKFGTGKTNYRELTRVLAESSGEVTPPLHLRGLTGARARDSLQPAV